MKIKNEAAGHNNSPLKTQGKTSKTDEKATATEQVKKKSKSNKTNNDAYEVSISSRKSDEANKASHKGYSPEEIRTKAKAFLESGQLPPEQAKVLNSILNGDTGTKEPTKD